MRRRILGFEAWARCRLRLTMVLKCWEGRIGDRFGISERLSVVDAVLINNLVEMLGTQRNLLL